MTPIAGTTRDTIEEFVNIKGLAVRLIDTAGILEHRDEIERQAVVRSHKAAGDSDLVLFVLDGSMPLSPQDLKLKELIAGAEVIVVVNKNDLPQRIGDEEAESLFGKKPVKVCAFKTQDIAALEDEIFRVFFKGEAARFFQEGAMVSNLRHIEILRCSQGSLAKALESLNQGLSMDLVAMDLRKAADVLGELTGDVFTDDLLDIIFSKFCIGK